ncbi:MULTISPECIES: DEAD/DEAH box helicase [Actinosynnema]|uniref:DEAD/DEAH box helicase n=1 Tax=Actinosynnema TaxID=40566 RepID=UPI0020A3ADFF|nr:DEAD/DEAH box helicase [Actinosynnema pretiosum]MCP2092758.1 protein of unknown function (DUF1998) [Actinosynnema pretiosum]
MRPTLEARGLKESLLQYLSTTYALSDEGARESLHRFLGDETTGMFRGPFLRIRPPFTPADDTWRDLLDWAPENWTPYAHQAKAFARLSSANDHVPQPTLITTGTGSGKTEAFLYPILDHCLRARAAGGQGIKAVLLYPMNALATDQAHRISDLLDNDKTLNGLTAGLYIGDRPATTHNRVYTRRSDMWVSPPDILITNYKMLDLLLQRSADSALWQDADIRYVVVDEFHSYDGAQGTDVAMLLRRLAAAVGSPEPDRPLGPMCPIATSATLASGTGPGGGEALVKVATEVFGTPFTEDAVIGEHRQGIDEFIPPDSFGLEMPAPSPEELAGLIDPTRDAEAWDDLVEAATGKRGLDPFELGAQLKKSPLTYAVMRALEGGAVSSGEEVLGTMWRYNAHHWARTIAQQPEVAAKALARFVALLSVARAPESTPSHPRPLVHVEIHQWARAVSRIGRGVLPWPKAEFRWDTAGTSDPHSGAHARTTPATAATSGQAPNLFLPAIYCRDCGRSGWAVFSPESDDQEVQFDSQKIRRSSTGQDKVRVRNLMAATDLEAREGSGTGAVPVSRRSEADRAPRAHESSGLLMVLDGQSGRLRLPNPATDYDPETHAPKLPAADSAFVLVLMGTTANTAAREDWCPACGERNAIRYLGTGSAALAAASITQLFTGGELDKEQREDKLLMFNDSVQDAAHRAGFVASRSYTFSLRALLKKHLSEERPTALNDLIADVVAQTTEPEVLRAIVPTDLHDLRGVTRLLTGQGRGGDLPTWRLIGERLAFEALMEFGFRSRNGRTLELTRTAAAHVVIPDHTAAIELVKGIHLELGRGDLAPTPQDDARYLAFLRVFLERLRTRGAIKHHWLRGYLSESGTSRYYVWGGREPGMRAFPKGVAAPRFLLAHPKKDSEFDVATGRLSWYERWAQRCLEIPREQAPELWNRLLPELVAAGLLAAATPKDSTARIYGLQPGNVAAQLLTDDEVNLAFVRCRTCSWEQTVHPSLLDQWRDQPCPSYRCATGRLVAGDRLPESVRHFRDRDHQDDYYRHLYRKAGTYQVITAEHTGMLKRAERERVEADFRQGDGLKHPNVLSCTPTLEMGIDIGDLSAVVLAALPHRPANYAQQVGRAGRRTGNAFLLTIPGRTRRDLYFLDQPREMIAGQIVPPGCHLSAYEILRRQYLAHLLDLAARERLPRPDGVPLRPVPEKAPDLFGPSGYLADLVESALERGDQLVEGFLALFPTGVGDGAKQDLRDYATRGLRGAVEEAEREWRRRELVLRNRLKLIDEAQATLHDSDPEHAAQKKELAAEQRVVRKKLTDHGQTPAQNAMCDLGLLPNYALIDAVTTLQATLYSPFKQTTRGESEEKAKPTPPTLRSYDRPQRYALSELAPGNTFYVNGYRHQVTGMEIGTDVDRQWREWRFCPDCGYVRTENAAADRSPCVRCRSTGIADDGACLHKVVEPTIVTSRDKREDARISDDKDDREQRFYTVVDVVDIPHEAIEPNTSWRHEEETFGVDFCRKAVIRRVNVGPARFDKQADDRLAGNLVRFSPFHVCTGCGATTADGKPVFDHDTDALSASMARDPKLKHHLPWCPLRRGKRGSDVPQEPLFLAHTLRTEALRVLLPTVTVLVEEKIHSFRAALRLGVDKHFGGDPQHLDTTLASMPDQDTGEQRHFLVLFDRIPGGTGYLHRLTDPNAFRAVLDDARRVLLNCPCKDESRRACHRCLHRHTEERWQDTVSRKEALAILGDLLGTHDKGDTKADRWKTASVPSTQGIGLDGQIESELEARFLAALRQWVNHKDDVAWDEDGRNSGYLRFAAPENVVSWRLTAQRETGRTRTDFTFERVDGPRQRVTAYLDGYRYHATSEHNRIASDCEKRNDLRASGHTVFQITWDDVELFEERGTRARPVWPPYQGAAQNQAKEVYGQLGGRRTDLDETVFTNPMASLFAYLRHPEPQLWGLRSTALMAGLLVAAEPVVQNASRADVRTALRAALGGEPVTAGAGRGPVHVLRAVDQTGLPIVCTIDFERGDSPQALRWSALIPLEDEGPALDTEEHRLRWRSWLYWSNLVQFLAHVGGDAVQLATSQVPTFPLDVLKVVGGAGELDSLVAQRGGTTPTRRPDSPAKLEGVLARALRDRIWDEEILDLLEEDEPDSALTELAKVLADRGKIAPVYGHELGEQKWQVDFGWPGLKDGRPGVIADSPEPEDEEARKLGQAYAQRGWDVRTAEQWLDDLDSLLDLLPDVEGAERR